MKPSWLFVLAMLGIGAARAQREEVDLLLVGGRVMDGTGSPWMRWDVGVSGDRIKFVGDARAEGVRARETVSIEGLLLTPGFIDMHSHAGFSTPEGRRALAPLHQGITTVVLGVDGAGSSSLREIFAEYERNGIAVNVARYVGHGAARREVMGEEDRPPSRDELDAMRSYVRRGMEEGAFGLSTGLFYVPGFFAETAEVVELAREAARFGGVYDTHDRDLGASYRGIGYLASIREAIEIGERAGLPVIFSHFNAQGVHNYGRAPEGARLVEEARARGVNVMAAQHPYTATNSSLTAYAIPRWAASGGREEMRKRFQEPERRRRLLEEIPEMLAIRGGAEKLVFSDPREDLNGRTLARVADELGLSVPEAVLAIVTESNPSVMNHDLYDMENTELLARQEWMMTCTDGGTPEFGKGIVHPRSYGAFTFKLRSFVYEKKLISLPFAIRGMTSLGAAFLGLSGRGLIREGFYADLAVFDEARIRDRATYDEPHRYSEGTVHVLVNGAFAFRDGAPTETLAGRALLRGER